MNIFGIGTDIVQQTRITALYERFGEKFVNRILSIDELKIFNESNRPPSFLAKRFAAKEAVAKALGTGIGESLAFHEISITNLPSGQPQVTLLGKAAQTHHHKQIMITIADEKEYAVAFAMILT